MKRNAGAREGEGKLESRFAALTSGLLARKGFAAPSNSPVADPAEETDAFALEPTNAASKRKAAAKAAPREEEGKNAAAPDRPPVKKIEPLITAGTPATGVEAKKISATSATPAAKIPVARAPMTVINERSSEAGYPDNPSAEEIAALDAEADEVVSYFENFGNEAAVAIEKDNFYGRREDEQGAPDDLDRLDEDAPQTPQRTGVAVAGPWADASVPRVAPIAPETRAGVTVELTAREFVRLSLGAAELQQSAQDLIVEAIEEYLDARGVLSLGGCSCLAALQQHSIPER